MYLVFLINAIVLVYLGIFIALKDKRLISLAFLAISISFAVWGICVFIIRSYPELFNVNYISKIQLLSSLCFFNGFLYFSYLYPNSNLNSKIYPNIAVFVVLTLLIIFTDFVTATFYIDGGVVYEDGSGWLIYTFYMVGLFIAATLKLLNTANVLPDYRSRIKVLLFGIVIFVFITIVCNAVLPVFGNLNFLIFGYLSLLIPPYFIAYAIAKQKLLNADLLINKYIAWALTIALIVFTYILVISNISNDVALNVIGLFLCIFWALAAIPCQQFLLTSARRKFIRNWYEPDDVISEISEQLTVEKDRDFIFTSLFRVLDEVFQLEKSSLIIAVRNNDEEISHYEEISHTANFGDKQILENSELVQNYQQHKLPVFLDDCEREVKNYLINIGYKLNRQSIVIPFYSPEFLEGIIIMGERSNQAAYNERDLRFMLRLVSYISAILYRLTPFEKLEEQYFANREKLHDAEIQLIRAQKIEAIVHATRQCHHEIRTPLNIIQLGIGRIKNLEDLESYKKYANEEVTRALEIVDETLTITDVSKADEARLSSFDINEVIRRSVRVVDLERYQLDLGFNNLPDFEGSFSDMQVVIANLIHNAIDAMPEGGMLALRTSIQENNIIIEVEDSGVGIEDNVRSKVWEPYYSGKETEVGNSTAGRGWGLTIVNRIITEHKGTINFSSVIGEGTVFTITLPIKKSLESKNKKPRVF